MSTAEEKRRLMMSSRSVSVANDKERKYVVSTDRSGDIHVHVQGQIPKHNQNQGDLGQQDKRCVFLTVHDLGTNHTSLHEFVNSPCMLEIRDRSCFIHVDVPGHEDNAPDLPDSYQFPSLQTLGEDLVTVLDFLHVKYAVGLGEGAGANVLARCGMAHPRRLLGLVLINATGSAAGVLDSFKNKFLKWKGGEVTQSEEDFLLYHKFGHNIIQETDSDKERVLQDFVKRLRGSLNSHNLKLYVRAFLNRKDLSLRGCQPDILLVTGTLSSYAAVVEKLHKDVGKDKVTLFKIERAGDVLSEEPAKVAQSILLFCQGQGLLTSLSLPGVERRMSRAMSMEEYDKPNVRRLSLTPATPPTPPDHANNKA